MTLPLSLYSHKDHPLKIDSRLPGDAVEHALRGKYSGATVKPVQLPACFWVQRSDLSSLFQKIKDICLSELRCLAMSSWTCLQGPCPLALNPQAFGSEGLNLTTEPQRKERPWEWAALAMQNQGLSICAPPLNSKAVSLAMFTQTLT